MQGLWNTQTSFTELSYTKELEKFLKSNETMLSRSDERKFLLRREA